jgi:hypothetical protein
MFGIATRFIMLKKLMLFILVTNKIPCSNRYNTIAFAMSISEYASQSLASL